MSAHLIGVTGQESLFWAPYPVHKHLRESLNDLTEHAAPTSPAVYVSQGSDDWLETIQRERNESCSSSDFVGKVFRGLAKESSRTAKEKAIAQVLFGRTG